MSNGTHDNTILLDLNKVDFESHISGNEIWQKEAVNEFTRFLSRTAQQAKKREDERKTGDSTIIHDAIFIGGARGTGKTVFLQNIEGFWDNSSEKKQTKLKLHFCKSIDPTLLVNHDNFTNVVIAHLYNEVENHIDEKCRDNSHSDGFYQALKNVCQALGKQENLGEGISGLDRVIKYRSGIQVIQLFETFLRCCINLLGVTSIVLPIDDIDMALERSHDILDVVRRMLASHLIIPVITGDLELYEPIITHRFKNGDSQSKQLDSPMLSEDQAVELTKAYLTKVLPYHNRVNLDQIKRLVPRLRIIQQGANSIDYPSYIEKVNAYFFGPVNGEEHSDYWPYPETAREMSQLIRDITPFDLIERSPEHKQLMWKRFKTWGEFKHSGNIYALATSVQQLMVSQQDGCAIALRRLLAFNPMEQVKVNLPELQQKEFFSPLHKIFSEGATLLTSSALKHMADRKILSSLPVVENVQASSYIRTQIFKDYKEDNDVLLFLNIYTFNNYYSETNQAYNLIFFSRAFELLASSLINNTQHLENKANYWQGLFEDIFSKAPFHTIYALFPTKTAFSHSDDEPEEIDDDIYNVEFITRLVSKVEVWEDKYLSTTDYSPDEIIPLIYAAFNKIFSQMNLLLENKNAIKDDTLADLSLRFKYIVMNAFSSFLKPKKAVFNNVAFTPNVNTIRDFNVLKRADNSIKINLGEYFEFKDVVSRGTVFSEIRDGLKLDELRKAKLLQAISHHPIFTLLDDSELNGDFLSIGKKGSKVQIEKTDPKLVSNSDRKIILGGLTAESVININDVMVLGGMHNDINSRSHKLTGLSANELFKEGGTGSRTYMSLWTKFEKLASEHNKNAKP